MARTGTTKRYFSFLGGLNTDANLLAAPENTASILDNVDLNIDGSISRRLGLDFQAGFQSAIGNITQGDLKGAAISLYEWRTAGNIINRNIIVLRVGTKLYLFEAGIDTLSAQTAIVIDIATFQVDPLDAKQEHIEFASGKGFLFATGVGYKPFLIDFNNGSFESKLIRVNIRDTQGVDDETGTNSRPSTLSQAHAWNLFNQGWTLSRMNGFKAAQGGFPSNADIQHLGYRVDVEEGTKLWDPREILNTDLGTSPAARGAFILDAFEPDRLTTFNPLVTIETVAGPDIRYNVNARGPWVGIPTLLATVYQDIEKTVVTTLTAAEPLIPSLNPSGNRPRAVAFYSGRVWYGSLEGNVYFSQVMQSLDYAGKCYQEQDPTAEDFNELVDTDGGVIFIPAAGDVVAFREFGNSILVFSSGGVWSISGGSDATFSANNSAVTRISEVRISNAKSVVEADGLIYFWASEGVFTVVADEVTGRPSVVSLSLGRIHRLFDRIPVSSKRYAEGSYDKVTKKIYWSYSSAGVDGNGVLVTQYNRILLFDISLNAFYTYDTSLDTDNYTNLLVPFNSGIIKRELLRSGDTVETITHNGVTVQHNTTNVHIPGTETKASNLPILTLCVYPISTTDFASDFAMTFGEFDSRSFLDFEEWHSLVSHGLTGASQDSVIEVNPETLQEGTTDKQATYLISYSRKFRLPTAETSFSGGE